MQIGRKHNKSIEQYRHNIKLLKYHLKKQQRINETLKYKSIKNNQTLKNHSTNNNQPKQRIYNMLDTVSKLNRRIKQIGITLGDLFRMADTQYQGQINKGQFLKVVNHLKAQVQENLVQQLFYAIDTNLNGILDQDQYLEFLCAYGGADFKDALRFQKKSLQKLAAQLKKKSIKSESFLADSMDPISVYDFKKKLSSFSFNDNQIMILLKAFDPASTGQISHEFYVEQIKSVKQKNEQMIANEQMQKDIKYMCVQWRQKKINPIKIFEEADSDKKDGVSPFELQEAFVKLMPNQTKFNIKKWVKIINLNNDRQISRQQFVNSIRSFYALNQLQKFSSDYEKENPNAKRAINNQEISVQTIMKLLQQKIQDSKMTKTMAFKSMDINGDGTLNKQQLTQGLKKLGLNIVFIGKVLTVFDRNCSESIQLEQWLKILGDDIEMSQIDVPQEQVQQPVQTNKQIKSKIQTMKKDKIKQNQKTKPKFNQKNKTNEKTSKQVKKTDISKKQTLKKTTEDPKPSKILTSSKENKNESKKLLNIKDTNVVKQTKELKQSKQNIKKQEPSTKTKKQTKQAQEQYEQDYDNEELQVDITEIQKQVAIKYKKRPQEVLSNFKKYNIRSKPVINLSNLKLVIQDMGIILTSQQAKRIFQDNIQSGGFMDYKSWLQRIAQEYAADIQQLKVTEPKIQKKIQQKASIKIIRTDSNMIDSTKKIQPIITQKVQKFNRIESSKSNKTIKNLQTPKINDFIEISEQLQNVRKEFLKKAQKFKQNQQKFTDSDFPPSIKSISPNPDTSRINNASQKVKFLKWKHFSQIYKNSSLVQGKIQPNDIIQGGLGNCYFLSALACLAQYPGLIERLFQYYDLQSGYFLIWLCIDGKWKLYEVDGNIVVNAAGTQPYFSCNNKEQLWVMLLQKAYAKAYGSYQSVIGGDPASAIRDLSGSPSETLIHGNIKEQQLWQKLIEANKNQFIMASGTDQQTSPQKKIEDRPQGVTQQGLVLGHAYSILDLHQQGKQKIIQMRNPWGKIEWKGDWSDQSSKWTQKMKKKLNYYGNVDDGIFWMPFGQYFKRYKTTSINFLRGQNFYQSSTKSNVSSLLLKASGTDIKELYLIVNQQDRRKLPISNNNEYVRVNVIPMICQKDEQPIKVVRKLKQKTWRNARQATIKIEDISEYQQLVAIIKLQNLTNVTVSLYGNQKLQYSLQQLSSVNQLQYFQAIAFQSNEDDKNQTQGLQYWVTSVGSKAFLCFKNISCPKNNVTIDISQLDNLKIISPQKKGKNTLKIAVGQTKCIRAQIINIKQSFAFKNFSLSLSQ